MRYETLKIYINEIKVIKQGLTEAQALYWVRHQNDTLKHPDWIASMRIDSRDKLKTIISKMNWGIYEN